jgi:hypothetical protein
VKATELEQTAKGKTAEKSAQCGRIGICGQAGKHLEHAILTQQFGRVEASQAEDDRIEERQQHLGDGVRVVALTKPHSIVEVLPQLQSLKEQMEEKNAAVLSQVRASIVDTHIPRPASMAQRALQNSGKSPARITLLIVELSGHARNPGCAALRLDLAPLQKIDPYRVGSNHAGFRLERIWTLGGLLCSAPTGR